MQEELIQLLWSQGKFNQRELRTTDGEEVTIESPGTWNHVAGPDFEEARIRIADALWVGFVEIHTRSSEWNHHGHQHDRTYNGVILHVVFEDDATVVNESGHPIPTLELKGRIPRKTLDQYQQLKRNQQRIPCEAHLDEISPPALNTWLDRVLVQRLERKARDVQLIHEQSKGDWMQSFYMLIAGQLAQPHNKLPMMELARKLNFSTAAKMIGDPMQLEAALFGKAGLLPASSDDPYVAVLIERYRFYQHKYNDHEHIVQPWKFGGIRPSAFPTRRVALLAALLPQLTKLQRSLLNGHIPDIKHLASLPPYWRLHFTFNAAAKTPNGTGISGALADLLMINALVPYLFYHAQCVGSQAQKDFAISLLEKTSPEVNRYTKLWKSLGVATNSGATTQALLELSRQYCEKKNCVICNVGKTIITKS